MEYAVYVRSTKDKPWMLIGFGVDKYDAEEIGLRRLNNMNKGAEWNFKRFKTKADAPEKLKSLRS